MYAIEMLPKCVQDVQEYEEGRSARGRMDCPYCGEEFTIAACIDVGGLWLYCPKCGMIDV